MRNTAPKKKGWQSWQSWQKLAALGICGLFGLLMQPFNQAMSQQLKQAKLLLPPPQLEGRDQLTNQLAFFTLGGLRNLAAQILVLDAIPAWIKRDWLKVEQRYSQITSLVPHHSVYWENASFEMATNAAATPTKRKDLTDIEINKLRHAYFVKGEQFLLKGIENNPDSMRLYSALGDLYSNIYRYPQFSKAAEAYSKAIELGASPHLKRNVFYSLCRAYGQEKAAYALGRELFENPSNRRYSSMSCLLFALQNELQLPENERLSINELFGSKERALRLLKSYERNKILYPTTGVKAFLQANKNSALRLH